MSINSITRRHFLGTAAAGAALLAARPAFAAAKTLNILSHRVHQTSLGEGDAAHWLVCGHVLHLAYFSPDRDVAPLVPWDLLTRAEKRGAGKLP